MAQLLLYFYCENDLRLSAREEFTHTKEPDMELIMSGLLIGMSGMLLLLIVSASKHGAPRNTDHSPPGQERP